MIKILKRNQVIIYVIALMLVAAGYLNYTTTQNNESLTTSMQMEASDDMQIADIGDATLVSSNDIIENTQIETNSVNNSGSLNMNTSDNQSVKETSTEISDSDEYFTKSKLERDTMYSQMIETYEKILNTSNSLETQKQTATQEISKINEIKNKIMICENLIKTKGFENSVIFVNGDSISVIIGTSEIKQEEIAQVQNIISREMESKIENIHISTK